MFPEGCVGTWVQQSWLWIFLIFFCCNVLNLELGRVATGGYGEKQNSSISICKLSVLGWSSWPLTISSLNTGTNHWIAEKLLSLFVDMNTVHRGGSRANEAAIIGGAGSTGDGCNAGDGHMAVFHSSAHAYQQVSIQAYSFTAPSPCGTICFWCPIQSPIGRFAIGYHRWCNLLPYCWDDPSDSYLLFLICYSEDSGWPLWVMAARKPIPPHFPQQHCIPWYSPSASWHQIQFLTALLFDVG